MRLFAIDKYVMIIDYSRKFLDIIKTSLKCDGIPSVSYADGIEALRALREQRHSIPDLVILDIELPKMDGYEVARHLRTKQQFGNTVIVMLSKRDGVIDRLKGRLAGARDYITKPFKTQQILSVVHSYLGAPTYS